MRFVVDRKHHSTLRSCAPLLLIVLGSSGPVLGCAKLPLARATRCDSSMDCNGGLICEEHVCSAPPRKRVESKPMSPDEDSMRSDAAKDHDPPDTGVPGGGTGAVGGGHGGTRRRPPKNDHPSTAQGDDGGPDDAGDDDGGNEPPAMCSDEFIAGYPLALWLDAEHNVSTDELGHVESWTDRSANQHVAHSQGSAEAWPIRVEPTESVPAAIRFGAVDGQTVRRMSVPDHRSLRFGYDEFAYIAVLRYRNTFETEQTPHEIGLVVSKVCGSCNGFPGFALFANDNYGRNTDIGDGTVHSSFNAQISYGPGYYARSPKTGYNDDKIHVVAVQRVDAMLILNVDGHTQRAEFVWDVDVSNAGEPISIGANQSGVEQALDGEIYQLFALHGPGSREIDPLIDCMLAKYGVPDLTLSQ